MIIILLLLLSLLLLLRIFSSAVVTMQAQTRVHGRVCMYKTGRKADVLLFVWTFDTAIYHTHCVVCKFRTLTSTVLIV